MILKMKLSENLEGNPFFGNIVGQVPWLLVGIPGFQG